MFSIPCFLLIFSVSSSHGMPTNHSKESQLEITTGDINSKGFKNKLFKILVNITLKNTNKEKINFWKKFTLWNLSLGAIGMVGTFFLAITTLLSPMVMLINVLSLISLGLFAAGFIGLIALIIIDQKIKKSQRSAIE